MLARSSDGIILSVSQSVRPSVPLSVCHTLALWRNEITYCRYFDTTWKCNHSSFWYQHMLVGDVPFYLKFALKTDPPASDKRRLQPKSAYNVWTVRASEKCLIIANRNPTMPLPATCRWSAYVTPNSPKRWLKKRICRFCKLNSSLINFLCASL